MVGVAESIELQTRAMPRAMTNVLLLIACIIGQRGGEIVSSRAKTT